MYIGNCLKMIRAEQDTPRGWTIRFNDCANTINGFLISTTIDIDDLYNDWYGDCFSCPENAETIFNVMIAQESTGRCYLIETYDYSFEEVMREIEKEFYM